MRKHAFALLVIPAFLFCNLSLGQSKSFSPSIQRVIEEKFDYLLKVEDKATFFKELRESPEKFIRNITERKDKSADLRESEIVISSLEETESEIHAAINPFDTNLITIAVIKQNVGNFQEPLTTPIYYSTDFGMTWNTSAFNGYTSNFGLIAGGGDPVLVYDDLGLLHYTWLVLDINQVSFKAQIGLHYATSQNGGANWNYKGVIDISTPFDLLNFEGLDKFVDKQWMATDQNNNSPFSNNVYVAYTELLFDSLSVKVNILCRTKKAQESSFGEAVTLTADSFIFAQFSSMDVDNSGNLHVTFVGSKDSMNYQLYHCMSSDGGKSFNRPREISKVNIPGLTSDQSDFLVEGISPDRLYPCPHVKVDKGELSNYQDRIYTFWTSAGLDSTLGALNIYFAYSDDQGVNWSVPRVLGKQGDHEYHQFYSSINITANGRVVATYYDRSSTNDSVATNYVLTQSMDGGNNWSDPTILTGNASDFSKIGLKNGQFGVGEYNQTLVTNHQAIPIWADGRTNDGNINVYAAFTPFNLPDSSSSTRWQTLPNNWSIQSLSPIPIRSGSKLKIQIGSTEQVELSASWIDTHGKVIDSKKFYRAYPNSSNSFYINSPQYSGVYFLKLESSNGFFVKKVVVH